MESRKRSLVKSVSWRTCAFILTFLVGWLVTGSMRVGATVGLADFAIKIVTFYAHERLWLRIQWGACARSTRMRAEEADARGGIG